MFSRSPGGIVAGAISHRSIHDTRGVAFSRVVNSTRRRTLPVRILTLERWSNSLEDAAKLVAYLAATLRVEQFGGAPEQRSRRERLGEETGGALEPYIGRAAGSTRNRFLPSMR